MEAALHLVQGTGVRGSALGFGLSLYGGIRGDWGGLGLGLEGGLGMVGWRVGATVGV